MNKKELLEFYTNLIQDDFMPYWLKFYDYEKKVFSIVSIIMVTKN